MSGVIGPHVWCHRSHGAIAARVEQFSMHRPLLMLCCTFTDEQDVVVAEAHWALAAEAADLIDTHSVGTDSRDLAALVDI